MKKALIWPLIVILFTTMAYADYKYGNEVRKHYPNYPSSKILVAKGVEILGLSFNGRGLPVVFMKEVNGTDTVLYGVQYEDNDNDGTFYPSHVYDIVCP